MTTQQPTRPAPVKINGFTIKVCDHDTPNKHYLATRGEVILVSKSLGYLLRKINKVS